MKKLVLGALFSVLALSGCGNDKNEQPYGGMYAGQYGGQPIGGVPAIQGFCDVNVVDAYNDFQTNCDNFQNAQRMNFQVCRMKAQHFIGLYDNISCVVIPPNQNGFNGFNNGPYRQYFPNYQGQQVFHITSFPMHNLLQFLEQNGLGGQGQGGFGGQGNNGWQRNYPRWPHAGNPRHNGGRRGF